MTISLASQTSLRSANSVKTIYNDTNSIILSRESKIASAFDKVLFPSVIKNGIFERDADGFINPTPKWVIGYDYDNDVEITSQLAAGIHMQILPYYTKPNRVINATILNTSIINAPRIYRWNNSEYILMSGTYNLVTGHIEGAVLREFARYTDVWQGATIPEIKEESKMN